MRARLLLLSIATMLGCDASPHEELARVEQATVEGAFADEVFGQPSLVAGTEPVEISRTTTHFPAAVATDVQLAPGLIPVWIADRNANRVIGTRLGTPLISTWVIGQNSFDVGASNGGGSVGSTGLNAPSAIAFYRNNLLAVADTGNNRVLLGQGLSGTPWPVNAVYGQSNVFDTAEPNKGGAITADTLVEPAGVAFDVADTPRPIVSDTGNNRVVIFAAVTFAGDPIDTTAKFCIGQESCTVGLPNRGGSVSRDTLNGPRGIATYNLVGDPLRGFYVADTGNHRVLHFPAFGTAADLVYGQGDDFTTAVASKGGPSARSLRSPTGVAVDYDGSLWIADTGHHRVLHFPKGSTTADKVLGQPDLTSVAPPTTASALRLKAPEGVATTFTDVFVADTGFSRVLRYTRPCSVSCEDGDPCTNDQCTAGGCLHTATVYPAECRGQSCSKGACVPCSASARCQAGYNCYGGVCAIACANDAQCASGHCVDGFCCDRACDGPCESCAKSGAFGRCSAVEGQPTNGRSCSADARECGGRCDGFDGSRCVDARAGDPCGVRACNDGVARSPGVCRADGTCNQATQTCAPFACAVGGCHADCRFDYECSEGATCVANTCVPGPGVVATGGCSVGRGSENNLELILLALLALAWRRR